jgi:hypothetical protein
VLDPSNTTGVLMEIVCSRDVNLLKLLQKSCLGLLDPNVVIARLPDFTNEGEDGEEMKERREYDCVSDCLCTGGSLDLILFATRLANRRS